MMRKYLCFLVALLCPAVMLMAQKQQRPNVIFILADDMGYADLSCYGNPQIRTPFLDKMASEGFRGGSFMVSAPSCTPSRASFMTGRYPDHVKMPYAIAPGTKFGLNDSIFTVAKLFRNNHYRTMMIGKWHLGDQPNTQPTDHGFDHFFGMLYSHDYQDPFVKTDTTLAVFYDKKRVIEKPDYSKLMDLYTDSATAYIRNAAKSKEPFFLYLPYPMPHAPVATTDKWKGHSAAGLYGDVIEQLDDCVGKVLAALKDNKIDDNTLVIFTSDNGPWNNMPDRMFGRDIVKPYGHGAVGPLNGGKANTYEGGHRVPFIARWPGHIPAQYSLSPFIINDMLPTLAAATGNMQTLPSNLEGVNTWPLLSGQQKVMLERVLYYLNAYGKLEAVRKGDWKLRVVKTEKDTTTELFDLQNDISERHNLAGREKEKVQEMELLLAAYPKE